MQLQTVLHPCPVSQSLLGAPQAAQGAVLDTTAQEGLSLPKHIQPRGYLLPENTAPLQRGSDPLPHRAEWDPLCASRIVRPWPVHSQQTTKR